METAMQFPPNDKVKRGFRRGEKGLMTIAQQLQRTYAAIAMHVRSNCNAHTQQLLWDDKKVVFAAQEPCLKMINCYVFRTVRTLFIANFAPWK